MLGRSDVAIQELHPSAHMEQLEPRTKGDVAVEEEDEVEEVEGRKDMWGRGWLAAKQGKDLCPS